MKEKLTNGLTGKILAVLMVVGGLVAAGWAFDDRVDAKIDRVESRFQYDFKVIRDMEKALVRVEQKLEHLDAQLKQCNRGNKQRR